MLPPTSRQDEGSQGKSTNFGGSVDDRFVLGVQMLAFWNNNSIIILKICKPMQTSPLHVAVVTVVCLGQQPSTNHYTCLLLIHNHITPVTLVVIHVSIIITVVFHTPGKCPCILKRP